MVSEAKTIEAPTLRHELKARHLTIVVIRGSIGIGLFVASGATIPAADSGDVLLFYILISLMVYLLMTSLSELAVYIPVSSSFSTYDQNYVEEGSDFTLGWNYWYNWTVTIAVSLVTAQLVMSWWFPDTPGQIWSTPFLGVIFLLNYISVRGFGEAGYWFPLIKITTVITFIVVGVMMIFDIFKGVQPMGWSNRTTDDAPFAGSLAAMISVAMIVGFSFQRTESIGITAGESEDPGKNIPRTVHQVLWRILLFYMSATSTTGPIIPYTDPSLLRSDVKDINVNPFTLVFQHVGLLSAAAVMNAIILTAMLSTGNLGMCTSTRTLYTLVCDGKAPRIFGKLFRGDVPCSALYMITAVAGLCFLTSMFGNQTVYLWLLNTPGMTGLIVWLGIAIGHYRFHRGYVLQGHDVEDLPYRFGFFPLGPIFALVLCLIITLGQDYEASLKNSIGWGGVMATYIGIPLLLIIWLGYKLTEGTRFVHCGEMRSPDRVKR